VVVGEKMTRVRYRNLLVMQLKIFRVPSVGNALLEEEMNVFLRSKKILKVDCYLSQEPMGAAWCVCIQYLEEGRGPKGKSDVDWREKLPPDIFARFAHLRELRKVLAEREGVPPYAVFNNEELANISQMEKPSRAEMLKIKGIGEQKMDKYGVAFLEEMKKMLENAPEVPESATSKNTLFDAEEESEPPF
ncbi:MAG: HRDC domain-containing protein, partial [Saprospiraceae bacterium]